MKNIRTLLLFVLAALCLPLSAHARRPRGTEMTGVITALDHSTRVIVFKQGDGTVRQFVYAERAKFWHDGADSSPMALRPGMQVVIRLHDPLIGPDFVTHITLVKGQMPGPSSRKL